VSNQALLQNAEQVLREKRLENVRKEIENAKYHFGLITDKDIFLKKLIWMGPPADWNTYTPSATTMGKIYGKLAPEGRSRSLRSIVERIRSDYSGNTPEELLTALCKEDDWFGRHLSISTHFEPLLLSPLWVRTLRLNEKQAWGEPQGEDKFYIEDGSHRALVYALRLACGNDKFMPVPILWCRSWKHILCCAAGHDLGDQDLPPQSLRQYFERSTVDKYLNQFFDNLGEF